MQLKSLLKNKRVNGWYLFWAVVVLMSVSVVLVMSGKDMSGPEQVSAIIAYSVRWSVPWLYLAFAASSLQILFSSDITRWLLRNRRIFGLCFAVGMSWQISFIICLVTVHSDYYSTEVYVLRDVIEGLTGYVFLFAMTVTSFKGTRSRMKPKHWKNMHKWGIYFLWAYAFSVYWHALYYYQDPDWVDYLYYLGGLLALSLRIAAWSKLRLQKMTGYEQRTKMSRMLSSLGVALIALGFIGAALGALWSALAYEHLWDVGVFQPLELYMPYWPFIPYLPLFVVMAGAALRVKAIRTLG